MKLEEVWALYSKSRSEKEKLLAAKVERIIRNPKPRSPSQKFASIRKERSE